MAEEMCDADLRPSDLSDRVHSPRRTRGAVHSHDLFLVRSQHLQPAGRLDVPLSRWSSTDLAAEVTARGLVEVISASTVRRWLAADAMKPWQHRSWIFPRDPHFQDKAARVLDLYDRHWRGRELCDDEYVISADEKSQLQALRRRHRGLPPWPGRTRRWSSSTCAVAPWPTSPPTTCTEPTCSAGSQPRPGSPPSPTSSHR
jgi:hypothetical protein